MINQGLKVKTFLQEELREFDAYLRKSIANQDKRISEAVGYVFSTEGKRLRPILVLLIAKVCGQITPETYHGAVTVELLHTATLVHDDIVDESSIRRGKPSVNAVYDNTKAVLIGDYLLSTSLMESVKTNNFEIVGLIAELGRNLAEGELKQFALANEFIIDESAYFEVIDKKTASLMRACAMIGAITGGADKKCVDLFRRLGGVLGISFQIQDDIFDYYKANVGKPTGNDIREGKITLPLIYALREAPHEVSEKMIEIIRKRDYNDDNIERILSFAKEYKGIEYAMKHMNKYLNEAEKIINELSFSEDVKMLFDAFLLTLRNRTF